ncbi:Retrovirus-related Pol polyprotein from transposon [Apostichopus japonicus]|uniref:Retrovirus-related Pol polyprotein from transposon n=1 Tax=Stichopus japonicus TaxID=307972 RepID=A0A2G8KCM8_STIJA|nr:Retrovirus-related Pol polyprotein from transposon [Apostichopus japonicus]
MISHPKYVMAEGLVKYVDNNSHSNKVVVPGELVVEVIAHHHCTPTSPHLGMRKTISKICQKFWWKNLKSDVETFVKKCRQCHLSKPMYCKPSGYMESTTSRYPWDVMAMDLLGPFPESNAGNLYILVITDHFSRFSFLMTLKRSTGKVLRAVLQQLFCTWGACNKLVSDNGPQMVSKYVTELCILWGVKRIFTTPYHPQANWVERVNRNIVSMFCCFVKADVHTDWDVHVPEFMFALSSFVHDATGFFPAELFLHRRIVGPGEWVDGDRMGPIGNSSFRGMLKSANDNMQRQARRNKLQYNRQGLR